MKTTSKVLLVIGGVLEIVAALGFLIFAIVFLVMGSPEAKQAIIDGLNNGSIQTTAQGTPEEIASAMQVLFLTFGYIFLGLLPFAILAAVFSFVSNSKPSKTKLILTMVFSFLSGIEISLIGGIFGLIALRKE